MQFGLECRSVIDILSKEVGGAFQECDNAGRRRENTGRQSLQDGFNMHTVRG